MILISPLEDCLVLYASVGLNSPIQVGQVWPSHKHIEAVVEWQHINPQRSMINALFTCGPELLGSCKMYHTYCACRCYLYITHTYIYIYIYTTLHMYIHVIYIYIIYILYIYMCVCICVHDTFPRLAVRSCHYCEYLPIICCVKIRVQARWIFPCHRFFFWSFGNHGESGENMPAQGTRGKDRYRRPPLRVPARPCPLREGLEAPGTELCTWGKSPATWYR